MRFTVDKKHFLSALQTAQRGISKSPIPILNSVLIEAGEYGLSLTGSNLEVRVTAYLNGVEVDEKGQLCIPVKELVNLVKKLPDGEFTLTRKDLNALITYGKAKATLNCYDPDEYPIFPEVNETESFTLSCDILQTIANRVLYAVGDDELRPVFTGVLLQGGESLTAVATDTHRLASLTVSQPCPGVDVIIPGKALSEAAKIFTEGEVNISFSPNYVVFSNQSTCLLTRTIEGQYPDYKQVIPAEFVTVLNDVNPTELYNIVDRAASICDKDNAIIYLDLTDEVVLSTRSEKGNVIETLNYVKTGENMQTAVNAKYFADILKSCGSGLIDIEFAGETRPIVIRLVEAETEYTAITLPVRLR